MTKVASQTLKCREGVAEKTSLQTTTENSYRPSNGANATWRGSSFQTRAARQL